MIPKKITMMMYGEIITSMLVSLTRVLTEPKNVTREPTHRGLEQKHYRSFEILLSEHRNMQFYKQESIYLC